MKTISRKKSQAAETVQAEKANVDNTNVARPENKSNAVSDIGSSNVDVENSQPEINIGMVGHVDHGKTTLTEKLSGKWTDTHSEEIKRGITIRLGYADTIIYKCNSCASTASETESYGVKKICVKCNSPAIPLRKISIVDAPGHESLMATMLSGSTIMDGALLLVAVNERCPQPQTREHIMALQIAGIKNIVIVQNKIDLVSDEDALANYNAIKEFLKHTQYANAPIIPLSAAHNVNVDALVEAIQTYIPTPKRNQNLDPVMFIARSFDINKPGSLPENMQGGVLGGSVKQGIFRVGDKIEIAPGRMFEEKNQKIWRPLATTITALKTGGSNVELIYPGGSIAILTGLDPVIVKSDSLSGNIVTLPGKLPPVWTEFNLEVHLLERVVGAKEDLVVEPVKMLEPLMLNVNTAATVGVVSELRKKAVKCKLKLAICANIGERVTISRRIDNRFRLIGYGIILK